MNHDDHAALLRGGIDQTGGTWADFGSGTGQKLTVYTNLITGPHRLPEADGPDELHIVLVDNGRSQIPWH